MENNTKCVCGKYCGLTSEEKINIYLDSIFGPVSKQEQEQNSTNKSSKSSITNHFNILRIIFGLPGIRYQ